jgi:hypothetical protein
MGTYWELDGNTLGEMTKKIKIKILALPSCG